MMKLKKYWRGCARWVCAASLIGISCGVVLAQNVEGKWISLDGQSEPGTPVRVSVVESTPEQTTLSLKLPGIFVQPVEYGGRQFMKVEMPEGLLDGLGFPKEPGERGWYDFPAKTGYPPLPEQAYRKAYAISTPKPVFPLEALGQQPRTAKEMEELGIDPAGARPGIPAWRGVVAVTRQTTEQDLQFEARELQTRTLELAAPLAPAGFEGRDQQREDPIDGYIAPELIDEEFYADFKGSYTGTETLFSPVSGAGAFAATEVRMPLVEVITPSQVEVVTDLIVHIKHLKGIVDFECPLPWDLWVFKMPFINGEALRESLTAKGIKIQASRSAHYLILTPREYRDDLETFARWKQAKGLNVDFAYVGNDAGDDVPADRDQIDQYIEEYFRKNFCHGVYVLLVGDVDVIPGGRSERVIAPPDAADADSDHVYEVLGNDRFPSLYVGRLSVNSSEELQTQLHKILDYERSPVAGDWPRQATLAANSQNDDGSYGVSSSFPSKYAAAVNMIADHGSYLNPPAFEVLHAGAATSSATRAVNQDVIDAIDEGRGHVLYRGHGGQTGWVSGWDGSSTVGSSFTAGTHIPMLANQAYPIVYSIACQNARLRGNESISEVWMSDEEGAVAYFGASVNSYTSENHERAKGIFRAMYENGFNRLGPALAEAERISYGATGGGEGWDNNTFCYLLLGDPELTVRKETVRFPFEIGTSFEMIDEGLLVELVDPDGNPLVASFVNIVLEDDSAVNGFTSTEGQLLLPAVQKAEVAEAQIYADGFAWQEVPVTEQPIVLQALMVGQDGEFHLMLHAAPGPYIVEGSTDFQTWTTVDTVQIEGDTAEVVDPAAIKLPYRFYRARPVQ